MLETVVLFATIMISVFGMYAATQQLVPVWSSRDLDFKSIESEWKNYALVSAFAGVAVAAILYFERFKPTLGEFFPQQPIPFFIIVVMSFFTYFAALSAFSDSTIFKAPLEIAYLAMFMGIPMAVLFAPPGGLMSMVFFGLVPLLLFFTARGFGMADIRLLWVVTFAISWWSGWFIAFMLLGLGCLIQLFLALTIKWHGWGQMKMIKPSPLGIMFKKVWKKFVPNSTVNVDKDKKVARMFFPLLPALAISYTFGLMYLLIAGSGALLVNGGLGIFGI